MNIRDKNKLYEKLLHRLNFARTISMDHKEVMRLLDLIDVWSRAHSDRNGEISKIEMDKRIASALLRIERGLEEPKTAHAKMDRISQDLMRQS